MPPKLDFGTDLSRAQANGRLCRLPLLDRQPPARRHVMRGSAAVRVTGWRFVVAVLAAVIVGVGMVMLAGKGVGR